MKRQAVQSQTTLDCPRAKKPLSITDDAARANAAREEVLDEELLEFDEEDEDDDVVEAGGVGR